MNSIKTYKIVRKMEYNQYVLMDIEDNKKNYTLMLEFIGVQEIGLGDTLTLNSLLLDSSWEGYTQPYALQKVEYSMDDIENGLVKKEDLVGLEIGGKKILLQRVYG